MRLRRVVNARITDNGVEYFVPRQTELLVISATR